MECVQCGGVFHTRRPKHARYCSQRCKDRATKSVSCSECGKPMWGGPDVAEMPVCHPCRRAMREHGTVTMYGRGRCRCPDCKAANAAARRDYYARRKAEGRPVETKSRGGGRYHISKTKRQEIYERDDWICQLCSEPVDPDLYWNDDWAASLDHIEPQSAALIPNHSPENLRLAHRICNMLRGNRWEVAC